MKPQDESSALSRAATLAVAAQLALLGAWSIPNSWPATLAWVVAFGWATTRIMRSAFSKRFRALAAFSASPRAQHVALGSLGMLLGAWADAHFKIPPCMCCRWGPQTPTLVMLREQLQTYSTLGMMVCCGAAMVAAGRDQRQRFGRGHLYRCAVEWLGMCWGMMAVTRPCTEGMRYLPVGKLEMGHAVMVVGMALGAWACGEMAEVLTVPRRRSKA